MATTSASIRLFRQGAGHALRRNASLLLGMTSMVVSTTSHLNHNNNNNNNNNHTRTLCEDSLWDKMKKIGGGSGKDNDDEKKKSNNSTSSILDEVGDGLNSTMDGLARQIGNHVQTAVDSGVPTQLSYGFVSGYCSGLALKKIGRAGAVVFGMGFVIMQTLSYSGYIHVDHVKIKKDVEYMLDLDKDGDFDSDDAKLMYAKVLSILQFNMPAGGGFAAGFLGGLRSG